MRSHCRCGVVATANLQQKQKQKKKRRIMHWERKYPIQHPPSWLGHAHNFSFFFYRCQHPLEWSVRLFLWQPQHRDQWGLCVYLAWHLKKLILKLEQCSGIMANADDVPVFHGHTAHTGESEWEWMNSVVVKGGKATDNSDWPETNRPYLRWHRCRREGREERPPL